MNALAAIATAVLLGLPFPPPKAMTVTDQLKSDRGTVISVNTPPGTVVVKTPAGPVTFQAEPDTQIFSADGRPLGGVALLQPGQRVRVYYVVDNGAKAGEIDLL